MEQCQTCGNSGECPVCQGYGYEFTGDGDGCTSCRHTGECPSCSAAPALLTFSL